MRFYITDVEFSRDQVRPPVQRVHRSVAGVARGDLRPTLLWLRRRMLRLSTVLRTSAPLGIDER